MKYIRFFKDLSNKNISLVGGKNASLGEMISTLKNKNIPIPNGFAITADAYWNFIKYNNLEKKIFPLLKNSKKENIQKIGKKIRSFILNSKIPKDIEKEILYNYKKLSSIYNSKNVDVAIRSSATAEDLPSASFAGQLESFLNIRGEKNIISSCLKCYASLFTDRVIVYCKEKNFSHHKIALSIGIQKMIRSDKAGAGVIFTLDTETGFRDAITITAGFGLGENVVQGNIIPDEYQLFKPFISKKKHPIIEKNLGIKNIKLIYSKGKKATKNIKTTDKEKNSFVLKNNEIIQLGHWANIIEKHYKMAMDIEWAKDGITKKLYIVQARPETVKSQENPYIFKKFQLTETKKAILEGIAIGESITFGKVQIIKSPKEIKKFQKGNILVTINTSPDWVPIMKKAKGIITDHGGRTSHAAIVSRELNIPAIVGTNNATKFLKENQKITLNCSFGEKGYIYDNYLNYEIIEEDISKLPKIKTPIMINIASPLSSFKWWQLPVAGIGLARMEFIINNMIQIHPMALIEFNKIKNKNIKKKINILTKNYKNKKKYFIDILSTSISKIAASQYPKPVIVRLSDFKSNEYRALLGGRYFEEKEENPMIGFRGASRYYNKKYKKAFALECKAIKQAREKFGFDNIIIMVPFLRTLEEADKILSLLSENGLKKEKKLKIYMMCEIPSNIILVEKFSEKFDGFSIGSNDLTQLILGIDRDSSELSMLFDERNEAVKNAIANFIKKAHKKKCKVGICGQAPSDDVNFAKFLIEKKIDSISLNPDSVLKIIKNLSK
ncbi:MAG: phosphoenolpyruvate synthase [Chlamydiae bacterium SM23_39]|nr:MAG: phosphoenolpyruvate synthase [Chlamydiae bacterium SM23_39]